MDVAVPLVSTCNKPSFHSLLSRAFSKWTVSFWHILTSYVMFVDRCTIGVYIGEFLFVGCETALGVVPTVRCKKIVRRDVQWRSLTHPNLWDICEGIKQQPRTDWLRTFIDNTSEKLKFGSPKWMVRTWFSWSQTFFRFHVFWAANAWSFQNAQHTWKRSWEGYVFFAFFVKVLF